MSPTTTTEQPQGRKWPLYQPLGPNSIRLVTFRPRSTSSDLNLSMNHYVKNMGDGKPEARNETANSTGRAGETEQNPCYAALSYCWGDPRVTKTITVNDQLVDVTLNLWQALSAILEHHNNFQHYWVDAICLDQNNVEERNHQVHQMWRIYSGAQRVLAWLGAEDRDTGVAYGAMQRASEQCPSSRGGECVCLPYDRASLGTAHMEIEAIWKREYFTRTWIQTEVLQSSPVDFLCGRFGTTIDAFLHVARAYTNCGFSMTTSGITPGLALFNLRNLFVSDSHRGDSLYAFHMLLWRYCLHGHCSQPQDRFFALLSHPFLRRIDPQMRLKPDYSLPLDQLLLVILEWSGCLELSTRLDKMLDVANIFISTVGPAFGFNYIDMANPLEFSHWLCTRRDWDMSRMPQSLTLPNGCTVDCTGGVLAYMVSAWSVAIRDLE